MVVSRQIIFVTTVRLCTDVETDLLVLIIGRFFEDVKQGSKCNSQLSVIYSSENP